MTETSDDVQLHFSGRPRRLTALFSPDHEIDESSEGWTGRFVDAEKIESTDSFAIEQVRTRAPGQYKLALRLPPSTPPGQYQVTLDIDGVKRDALVAVDANQRSKVYPKRTVVRAAPGKTANVELEICNTGNVSIEVPTMSAFVLANSEALCRAIVTTMGAMRTATDRPLDRLVAEMLKEGYGGTVKARITSKDRTIEPGVTQRLSAALRMPSKTDAAVGTTYWGLWSVYPGKAHRVLVSVSETGG